MYRIKIVEFDPATPDKEKIHLDREADRLDIPGIVTAVYKELPKPRKPRTRNRSAAEIAASITSIQAGKPV